MRFEDVIRFWFEEATPSQWFTKDEAFDREIETRFSDTYKAAMAGETAEWRRHPEGRLAEILVLDQFSRNMFRDSAKAFAGDERALMLAKECVAAGDDLRLSGKQRYFIYLPYMHSESKAVHARAIWLFLKLPLSDWWSWISYEYKHKRIIDRFGRYPHRNEVLGRVSTPDEEEFLRTHPGF